MSHHVSRALKGGGRDDASRARIIETMKKGNIV
jgi:hypothetical protein